MPLTQAGLQPVLYGSLSGVTLIGVKTAQLAMGIANGVVGWAAIAKAIVTAAGTAGTGMVTIPLLVPLPALSGTMLAAFAAQAMAGTWSPQMVAGVSSGVSIGVSSQSLILTTVVGVGAGAGVAKIVGTAIPPMVAGFAGAGLAGLQAVRLATAIGMGMDLFFAPYVMPVPVVGPPSTFPGAGGGVGQIT
jgi:hypothetical protein